MNLQRRYITLLQEAERKRKVRGLYCRVNGCKVEVGVTKIGRRPDYVSMQCSEELPKDIFNTALRTALGGFGENNRNKYILKIYNDPLFILSLKKKNMYFKHGVEADYYGDPSESKSVEEAVKVVRRLGFDFLGGVIGGKPKFTVQGKKKFDSEKLAKIIGYLKNSKDVNFSFYIQKYDSDSEPKVINYCLTKNMFVAGKDKRVGLFWKKGLLGWRNVERILEDFGEEELKIEEKYFLALNKKSKKGLESEEEEEESEEWLKYPKS